MKLASKILSILFSLVSLASFAQNEAVLKIDTSRVVFKPGLSFPYWLNAGQSLKKETNVKAISVLEFVLDSVGNLRFSKPMSIMATDEQVVPEGKVWKIEAIGMEEVRFDSVSTVQAIATQKTSSKPAVFTSPAKFTEPGNYTWAVPPGVTNICVEVWGGGGNGGYAWDPLPAACGGGGGGYGYECFSVLPNTRYSIQVGGPGNNSSFGNLILALGGTQGSETVGLGGSSAGYYNQSGSNGGEYTYQVNQYIGGKGGDCPNGGKGGLGIIGGAYQVVNDGGFPGGGGGGASSRYGLIGKGASGQIIVHW